MLDLTARPTREIEDALEIASRPRAGCPDRLAEAIRYALLAPGKRLRPRLVVAACEACGGPLAAALPAAVAVEMIHAYSLIHDDLPAMDDDDLRRGRPTVHRRFDEATAILAGDALQALAFETLAGPPPTDPGLSDESGSSDGEGGRAALSPTQVARSVRALAAAAGPTALVGGQADDLAAERHPPDETAGPEARLAHLASIHARKTAALLAASCRLGAIAADADEATCDRFAAFGRALGLAFQITDDVLDRTATTEQLGKRTGKDDGRGKLTFPAVVGLEESRRLAGLYRDEALAALDRLDGGRPDDGGRADGDGRVDRAAALRGLAEFVLERTH